jgi:hypothetical protein
LTESEVAVRLAEGISMDVVQAKHLGAYQLRLAFSDGTEHIVDFGPFLERSGHPEIRSFLKPEKFASFRVEQGDLLWGDYELCFPVADLYEGHI